MNDIPVLPPEAPREELTPVSKKRIKEANAERGIIKTSTKKQKWQITPAMLRWVDTAVQLVTDSPSEISPKCNVSRVSWYHWCSALEGFEDWFYTQYKAHRQRWIPKLDAMGMARAPKNFDYWKAMNQKAGELIDEGDHQPRQVVSILGGMTLNTVNYNKVQQTSEQQDT